MAHHGKKEIHAPHLELLEDRTVPSGSQLVLDPAKVDLSRVMVHFKTDFPVHLEPDYYGKGIDVVQTFDLTPGIYEVAIDPSVDYANTVTALAVDPRIQRIDQNFRMFPLAVPNDPSYGELWGLNNTGQSGGVAGADIDAQKAWDLGKGTGKTIIADIDTGVDYNHPDLVANLWKNLKETPGNGIDDDQNGFIDDFYGIDTANNDTNPMDDVDHGTHVAGIIGATGNNNVGVVGVAWKTQIMSVKVLGTNGGSSLSVVQGLNYAVNMGAKIANMSLGGAGGSPGDFFDIALSNAGQRGVIVVAGAGNGGSDGVGDNNDVTPFYPSSYPADNLIAVAATDRNDRITGFSNYGLTSVDLAAPGASILSTIPGGGYEYFDGTSMATPAVAGALVVMMDYNPNLTYKQYINLILNGVDKLPSLNGLVATGGRLNLFNSMPPAPTIPAVITATASLTSGYIGDQVSFSATVAKPTPSEPVPTGKVDLVENNAVIASATLDENGKATFPALTLSTEGKRVFTVRYTATANGRYIDGTSAPMIVTTVRRETNLTNFIKVGDTTASSIPFGQSITLLAHLGAPTPSGNLPTGLIEFFINSKSYGARSVSLSNNQLQAQINVDGLPLGSYTTYATYKGDPIYGMSVSTSLKFTVVKAATATILTPQSDTAVVGETFAIQGLVAANLGAKIQGKVQFRLNGALLGSPLTVAEDGTVLLRNAFLLSQIGKNRQLTATFTDTSGNYSGSTSVSVPILITNTKTKIAIPTFAKIGEQVTFTATVSQVPGSAGTLGGYVEFFDGTKSLGTAPIDASGQGTLQLPNLDARQYQIRARYVNTTGTGVVDSGLTDPSILLVSRGGPSVTFTSIPSAPKTYGDNLSFSLEVRPPTVGLPIPTGTVIILFGTQEIQRVSLSGGAASFVLTPDQYQIGLNSVTARYLGDGNYASSDGTTVNFSVVKASTFTALELQSQAGAPVTGAVSYGSLLKIVTDVFNIPNDLPPNGSVTLITVVDGKERVLGQVNLSTQGPGWSTSSFTVEKLPVGQYQIKARYSATDRYEASESDSVSLTIVPGTSSVSLVGESRFKAKGQTSLTAVVDDGTGNAPVGIVRFYNNATSKLLGEAPVTTDITGSLASLSFTNDFAAGSVDIRAEFTSSKPGTQNALASQTLKIFDKPVNFTLVPNLTSVRVNDAVSLVVSLEVPVSGDFDVTKVRFYDSGLEVTPSIVSPFTASGNKFTGTFSLALNTVGTHALTAKYLGSTFIDAAESSRADLLARARVVASTQTSAVVVTDASGTAASGVLAGEKVKLSATVKNLTTTQNPDGSIAFVAIKGGVETVLGTVAVKALSTNQATAELTLANGIGMSGAYSVVARFQSGSDFTPSSSTGVNLKVVDGPAVVSFVGSANLPAGIATALTVKVDDGTGRSLPGKVNFFNDATNAPLGSADVVGGIATLTLKNGLPAGALRLRAEFVSSSFAGANSSALKDFVFLADSQITVTTALAAYKSTDLITITIGLDIPATLPAGQIQLYLNTQLKTTLTPTWNAATGRYEATYQVTGLSVGTNRLMAKYLGTPFTAPKESAVRTIVVRR